MIWRTRHCFFPTSRVAAYRRFFRDAYDLVYRESFAANEFLALAQMELALERAPRGKLAFGAQPQSVAFFDRIGCERKLTSFVAARPLKARRSVASI